MCAREAFHIGVGVGARRRIGVQNVVALVAIGLGQETGKWCQVQCRAGSEFQQLAADRHSSMGKSRPAGWGT